MIRFANILTTTDFSDASRPANFQAAQLAKRFDSRLHLLAVALTPDLMPAYPLFTTRRDTGAFYEDVEQQGRERLQSLAAELEIDADKLVIEFRLGGFAAPEILEYAKDCDADLIVMGTHGRRGFRRFLVGSVAAEVVRKAPCPVATFRPDSSETGSPERILAAVDLSDISASVIEHAVALAAGNQASLDLLHVIATPPLPVYYEMGAPAVYYQNLSEIQQQSRAALEQLLGECEHTGLATEVHVTEGGPIDQILALAERKASDLVVVGSRGLTGLSRVLLGSVAEAVVRTADCPVFTVHPREQHDAGDDQQQSAEG